MAKEKSPVGYRRDNDITSMAKGKGNTKFDNELSSIVYDFFYEFGIINTTPKNKK